MSHKLKNEPSNIIYLYAYIMYKISVYSIYSELVWHGDKGLEPIRKTPPAE